MKILAKQMIVSFPQMTVKLGKQVIGRLGVSEKIIVVLFMMKKVHVFGGRTGGRNGISGINDHWVSTDPCASDSWEEIVDPTFSGRYGASATVIADIGVLLVGGYSGTEEVAFSDAWLFNGTWYEQTDDGGFSGRAYGR